MINEMNLNELLAYESKHPVLSMYLNTEPSKGSADVYRLNLRNMLKDIDLPRDVAAVENYFSRDYDWSGRSVVVFSCATEGFFRSYPLAVPVLSRIRIGNHPHVKPLANLLDSYGGYGVVLIDKQGARVFSFHLGELKEQEGVLGESVRRTKRGGASAFPGRRGGMAGTTNYVEEITERNMREAVEFASHFFTANNVRRVLIGGTDENVAMFRSVLPKSWQSLIVGTFHMSMTASQHEVLERAMAIGREAELNQEIRLVKTLVTNAAKGRGGIVGLEDTLRAVHEGRVQTLIIREAYRAPGYRCLGCDYLAEKMGTACSFCGGKFEQIPDAVEMAVRQIMRNGTDVEVIPRELSIQGFDNIGAIVRY